MGSYIGVVRAVSWPALALSLAASATLAQAQFLQDGHAGFVVADMGYAFGPDAEESGGCPAGMTSGYSETTEVYVPRPNIPRAEGEQEDDYRRRARDLIRADPNIRNLCINPELAGPDPRFKTVEGGDIKVEGIDLDGEDSRGGGQCPHQDFVGVDGEKGIDNQFYRVVGCSPAFQSTGQGNTFATEMLTGSWGIVLTLDGVDDIRNDDSVQVGFYVNADPIQLSPTREPLPYATYAAIQDPRFRATTSGKIVDGVLTTEPVDINFYTYVNSIFLERPLRDARFRMTLSAEGELEGYIAGYMPVEAAYDYEYGFRNGTTGLSGEEAPMRLRAGSAIGQARVQGHTCEGAYFALRAHADGHYDPELGRCTSLSTQYWIKAIPAYVVDMDSAGPNDDLVN